MEAKKTSAADIFGKSNLFRSIGLLISMALVVTDFQWKSYEKASVDLPEKNINTFEQTLDIPTTEQP